MSMLLNKIYYAVKPYLPWPMRMAIRRERATKLRAVFNGVWPIK